MYIMGDVLRILDRFRITGRGVVYTVKISKGCIIHIGDVLLDLRGNRFEVSGIEMFRGIIAEGKSFEDMPLGLMFKQLDGVEAYGNILVKDLNDINLFFAIIRCIKEKLMKIMKLSIKRLDCITHVHYLVMKIWKEVSFHCLVRKFLVLQFIVDG